MLTIGKVAREAGLRASTIRYYESHHILPRPSRLPNGYRVYSKDALGRLNFIQRAQAFGMTLAEIKELLQLAGRGEQPCRRVQELARRRLEDVDRRIRELEALAHQLRTLVRKRPAARTDHQLCPLMESNGRLREAPAER